MHAKINVAFSQQLLVQKRPVLYQNGAKIDMFLGYFNMSSENGSKGLKTGGLGRSVGAPSDRDSPTVRGRVGRSAHEISVYGPKEHFYAFTALSYQNCGTSSKK